MQRMHCQQQPLPCSSSMHWRLCSVCTPNAKGGARITTIITTIIIIIIIIISSIFVIIIVTKTPPSHWQSLRK